MSTLLYLAVGKYRMSYDDAVWNTPLSFLLLMTREKIFQETKKHGIQLSTIEAIDEGKF